MATDADNLREQLALTGLSYADWEGEALDLERAADAAEGGRYVDRRHLQRAGELVSQIDSELGMLEEIAQDARGEMVAQILGVRDRLEALSRRIREAARRMHGLI
ncbi:hypothetical protein EMQ25_14185 [Arsenicitalea aurantiaca]|uniref:Uncharacterized protein n=1 Tax=Arsenicitalea aurantiaca TaxID=1783274 RepID=A0A433X5D5_9HYPH|nr:hypothetical protein [Arsenicitalea aurantiaca]RUT29272.1 hypothetical protein EMQ25_14185 [Arsenicitalea aurantiaca]